MKTLKRSFLQVQNKKQVGYGGNQAWFPYQFLQKAGCGVIAATDLLLYLKGKVQVSEAEYMDFAKHLWKWYFPVIPGFGMNGLTLMIGLNRYFFKENMPYRACWKISGRKMLSRIEKMLEKDIPVILSVGPNFPCFWGKEKVNFYKKVDGNKFVPSVKTKAHFVTVTGRMGRWLQISSWGKEYYIDLREYREYVKKISNPIVSNIICITPTKPIE